MLWEELSSKGFEAGVEKCGGLCVLPIGVLEKHGDHLPLGTDMYIAIEVVKEAVKKSPAVVFPYYFMGQIAEAKHVKGTIAPSHQFIMDSLLEMCDEIYRNGFTKILILSGHGGNSHFLPFFAQMMPGINRPYSVYTGFIHSMSDDDVKKIQAHTGIDDMGDHAGFGETALMMHLRPDLVDMDNVKVEESVSLGRLNDIGKAGVYSGFWWYAAYPNHFAGDPSEATAAYGKFMFDMLVENVAGVIDTVKADDVSLPLIEEFNKRAR